MDKISLVIPCYNEEDAIPCLEIELNKIMDAMPYVGFEIIFVDNCSLDGSLALMRQIHKKDSRYQYLSFSRNFGKDSSMYAGLSVCTGDYAAVMDADLQDPPELLETMYQILKTGEYDCAAAYRENREGEPWVRSMLAGVFYNLMGRISDADMKSGARDFRLMTRQMVDAVLKLEEGERFTKGIFSWVGFRTKWIPYENRERIAGKTKLPMKSAFTYAVRGITAFSTVPLVASSFIGIFTCIVAMAYTVVVAVSQLVLGKAVSGYSSLMCVMLFGFGIVFLLLGVIGQYLAQMYLELKHRPKYIIQESSLDI